MRQLDRLGLAAGEKFRAAAVPESIMFAVRSGSAGVPSGGGTVSGASVRESVPEMALSGEVMRSDPPMRPTPLSPLILTAMPAGSATPSTLAAVNANELDPTPHNISRWESAVLRLRDISPSISTSLPEALSKEIYRAI